MKLAYYFLIASTCWVFSSCHNHTKEDLVGSWEIQKVERDGMDFTDEHTIPVSEWIILDSTGNFVSGKQLIEYEGKWEVSQNKGLITLTGGSEWWSESPWRYEYREGYLFLEQVKMKTLKVILRHPERELPTLSKSSAEKDEVILGYWKLSRSKRDFRLVGNNANQEEAQWIRFNKNGRFLTGSDNGIGVYGDWVYDGDKITLIDNTSQATEWKVRVHKNEMQFSTDYYSHQWEFIWERSEGEEGTKITYVANEGVLIERNGKSLLIDAIHDFYAGEYLPTSKEQYEAMLRKDPPYQNITYLLISHGHGDHFDPEMTVKFLQNHSETDLVASEQVIDSIMQIDPNLSTISTQVIEISPDRKFPPTKKNGIRIEPVFLDHVNKKFSMIQNLGFLIEIDGVKFLHVGDAELSESIPEQHYEKEDIDVAILPYWYVWSDEEAEDIIRHINPKVLIATHISPDNQYGEVERVLENWHDAVIFWKSGDSWTSGN